MMTTIPIKYFEGYHRRWLFGLCLCLLSLPASAQDTLQDLRNLEANGAEQLVLQLMDRQQPEAQGHLQQWTDWERERLRIYQQTGNWSALVERTSRLPAGVDMDFLLWAKTARAQALFELQQYRESRDELRALIWSSPTLSGEQNREWLPKWRRQVIETYLEQGLLTDTYTAEQRYQLDYGLLTETDRFMRARILLLNNRIAEAVELLSKHTKDPQVGMLYLVAQLRSGERKPKKVLQAAFRQLRGKWVDENLKYRLWAVIVEAARRSGDRHATINALEHLVALVKPQQLPAGLFKDMDAAGLWQAYTTEAEQLGNQHQLLIGDDKSWLDYAKKIDVKDHLKARALYAFLILKGQQRDVVEQAAALFLKKTQAMPAAGTLLKRMFLENHYYKRPAQIPLSIRYKLVDIALQDSDIPLASRLMTSMTKAPADVSPFIWQLRRARILLMGGNIRAGYQAMVKILQENKKLTRKALDHYLQVVFDLQTLQQHEEAVDLFNNVIAYSDDQALRREVYFWMADSRKAEKKYISAAHWYLKSAILPGVKTMDPWAQAARYQAAAVLAKAGLVEDAKKIYQDLLRVTEDKNRVAVLKRELQHLRITTH